jgi:hypothetical protein
VSVVTAKLQDLAELKFAENVRELHLRWMEGPSKKKVRFALKTWRHLRRWTYEKLQRPCFSLLASLLDIFEIITDDLMQLLITDN